MPHAPRREWSARDGHQFPGGTNNLPSGGKQRFGAQGVMLIEQGNDFGLGRNLLDDRGKIKNKWLQAPKINPICGFNLGNEKGVVAFL